MSPAAEPAGSWSPDAAVVSKAVSSQPRPPQPSAASATMAFAWRAMLKIKHVPEQLQDATITPVLFVLMFTYLFGGAIAGSVREYLQFVLPGILVISVLFTTVYSGVALSTDSTKGVVDRFRSLPIWPAAPLVGTLLGESVRYVAAGAVVMVLGVGLGFRAGAGTAGILIATVLVVFFSFAVSWIFMTLGLVMRSPSAVLNGGFLVLFPMTFVSNVFVDPATLPSWLEAFVNLNPVSTLSTAARGLMHGTADARLALPVLAVAIAVVAIFGPLTTRLYRRR